MKVQIINHPESEYLHLCSPMSDSTHVVSSRAISFLTFFFFKEGCYKVEKQVFSDHTIILNPGKPYKVEHWLDGVYSSYIHKTDQVAVLAAKRQYRGKWTESSGIFVITVEKDKFAQFAQNELSILLSKQQLPPLPDPYTAASQLCTLATMMLDALTKKMVGSKLLFETLSRAFLVLFVQEYGEVEDGMPFTSSFTAEDYYHLIRYIETQYHENITVEDLARVSAMSISHFSRHFKRVTGKSPLAFVMSYRVEQAKKKLAENLSYADIACECGFSDQSHFNRVFKKKTGMTPKEYHNSL